MHLKAYHFFLIVSFAIGFSTSNAVNAAKPMRVATEVFSETAGGKTPKLQHQNVTLFAGERIYDFTLVGSNWFTVFDTTKQTAAVLDHGTKTQCVVSMEQANNYIEAIRDRSKFRRLKPHLKARLAGNFREEWKPEKGELALSHQHAEYLVKTSAPNSTDMSTRYRDFADWSAKLNTVLMGPPPTARLQLNNAVSARGLVPIEIHRVVHTQKKKVSIRHRSVHTYSHDWNDKDRQRVDKAEKARQSYRIVTLEQFLKPAQR